MDGHAHNSFVNQLMCSPSPPLHLIRFYRQHPAFIFSMAINCTREQTKRRRIVEFTINTQVQRNLKAPFSRLDERELVLGQVNRFRRVTRIKIRINGRTNNAHTLVFLMI